MKDEMKEIMHLFVNVKLGGRVKHAAETPRIGYVFVSQASVNRALALANKRKYTIESNVKTWNKEVAPITTTNYHMWEVVSR